MAENETAAASGDSRRLGVWFLLLLMLVVFAFMFYQSVNYIGLMYQFAEWQFAIIDRYFPVLSIIGLLILLYLIWEAVRFLVARLRRRHPHHSLYLRRVAARRSASRFLDVVAATGAALIAGTAIQWWQEPSSVGREQVISLASGTPSRLAEGAITVTGVRPIGPIARYSEDFLLIRRTRFLAPVGRSTDIDAPYNLFAEVRGMDPERDVPQQISGVLRTNALMPEIRALYSDANLRVERDSAIIFATPASANRPYLVLLLELIIISLTCWLFGRHFRRSANRMARAEAARPQSIQESAAG